jgi:hypothetical protein
LIPDSVSIFAPEAVNASNTLEHPMAKKAKKAKAAPKKAKKAKRK